MKHSKNCERQTNESSRTKNYSQFSIPISIGVAKCHPIDAYVKSIGRGISGSRMEYVWFVVDNILFKDDRVCLTLSASDEVYHYFMRAHVYRDSGNIRIIECHADLDTFN